MAEIYGEGYQSIRDFVEGDWIYHSILDDGEDEITRINVEDDDRAEWTHSDGDEVLEITTTISGSDDDISQPSTIAGSAIYNVEDDGDDFAKEVFDSFTIETDSDELTIKHRIEIPQQS